jgi:1,4-dihydroxy-6-naphthoate synthase
MSRASIEEFSEMFKRSIAFGLENLDQAVEYAMQYARGQPKAAITEFVRMYVNDLTLDMGPKGKKAIETMFEMAREKGIIREKVPVDVV